MVTTDIASVRDVASEAARRGVSVAERVSQIEVKSEEDYELSSKILKEIKTQIKALDEKRLEFTRPLNKVVRDINNFFREPLDAYRGAEKAIKSAMVAFRDAQREVQERALARARDAALDGDREKFARQLAAAKDAIPTAEETHTRKRWCFEVVDASVVPREFLVVDEKAIGVVVRRDKDATKIPGIRVWSEDVVVVR